MRCLGIIFCSALGLSACKDDRRVVRPDAVKPTAIEDSNTQPPTEFSYVEQERSSQSVESSRDVSEQKNMELKARQTMANATEVCTKLSLPHCVSCCENFFTPGRDNWTECVGVCANQAGEISEEY